MKGIALQTVLRPHHFSQGVEDYMEKSWELQMNLELEGGGKFEVDDQHKVNRNFRKEEGHNKAKKPKQTKWNKLITNSEKYDCAL